MHNIITLQNPAQLDSYITGLLAGIEFVGSTINTLAQIEGVTLTQADMFNVGEFLEVAANILLEINNHINSNGGAE